jgi:hypothetical protein
MNRETLRTWAVRATYASIAGHLAVGMLLPLIANAAMFNGYHGGIEQAFHGAGATAATRAHQVWWISLFGPTVQAAAVWMGALAWIGSRQRSAMAWGALIAGIVLWAPQDMWISLQMNVWIHVWIDAFALVCMLPPLFYLLYVDRDSAKAAP